MKDAAGRHRHRGVSQLLPLDVKHLDPRDETPLFAAGLDFAREVAGPLASAFLAALPAEWVAGHLVIDATLVWLAPGFRQGEMFWCHEPFPGQVTGVMGQSNLQQQAEHIACCCGPSGIEFLTGQALEKECSSELQTLDRIRDRHERLQSQVDAGALAIETVAPYTVYHYHWGAFHRHEIAKTSGFQYWIRATLGDPRPLVNGIRNATNL
jgi:hypothetical protein